MPAEHLARARTSCEARPAHRPAKPMVLMCAYSKRRMVTILSPRFLTPKVDEKIHFIFREQDSGLTLGVTSGFVGRHFAIPAANRWKPPSKFTSYRSSLTSFRAGRTARLANFSACSPLNFLDLALVGLFDVPFFIFKLPHDPIPFSFRRSVYSSQLRGPNWD